MKVTKQKSKDRILKVKTLKENSAKCVIETTIRDKEGFWYIRKLKDL